MHIFYDIVETMIKYEKVIKGDYMKSLSWGGFSSRGKASTKVLLGWMGTATKWIEEFLEG